MFKFLHECLYKPYDVTSKDMIYVCDLCHKNVQNTVYVRIDILSYCCEECYTSLFYGKEKVV